MSKHKVVVIDCIVSYCIKHCIIRLTIDRRGFRMIKVHIVLPIIQFLSCFHVISYNSFYMYAYVTIIDK